MKTALITVFDSFGGELINPSWEAASHLHERRICPARVVMKPLLCLFSESLYAAIDEGKG